MVGRPKGLPRTGGRKRGTPNRKKAIRAQAIAESGLSALGYLQSIYRDANATQQARIDCAKAAVPYESSRLATEVKHSGAIGTYDVSKLTDAELERVAEAEAILERVAISARGGQSGDSEA